MPQVPYQPYSTVSPSKQGVPYRSESVPAGAFGETVAAAQVNLGTAQEHFGNVLQKAGDEVFKRGIAMQEMANNTEAKEAESEYIMKAGELRAKYTALGGQEAVAGYEPYKKQLEDVRLEIRDRLSNDAVRRAFDPPSMNVRAYTTYNGASHAATENKKWAIGTAAARVEVAGMEAAGNPNDDRLFQRSLVTVVQNVKEMGAASGWSPDQIKKEALTATSTTWSKRIAALARQEPFKARDMFEAAKARGDIQGDDLEKVDKIVESNVYTSGARNIAEEVAKEDKGEKLTLSGRLAKAEEKAAKLMPEDASFKKAVLDGVSADWNRMQSAKRDGKYNDTNTLEGALYGSTKGGKIPTTVEELTSTPEAEQAWSRLDNKTQNHYRGALAKNAKGDVAWTKERFDRNQQLRGLAQMAPADFLEVKITDEDLPWSAKAALLEMQRKAITSSEGNPATTKAMSIIGPDLRGTGIQASKSDDRYRQLTGNVHDAILDYQNLHKKVPGPDEMQAIGRRLLAEQAVGMWSGQPDPAGWSKTRTFELPVPEVEQEKIRVEYEKRGYSATKEQIQRIYIRDQLQKFHAGRPSSATRTSDPRDNSPTPPISK